MKNEKNGQMENKDCEKKFQKNRTNKVRTTKENHKRTQEIA